MGHMNPMYLTYYDKRQWHADENAVFGEPIAPEIKVISIRAWVSADSPEEAALMARGRLAYMKRLGITPGDPPVETRRSGRLAAKVACAMCWAVSVVGEADGGAGVLEELASCDGFNEGHDALWFCSDCQQLIEEKASSSYRTEGRASDWEEDQRCVEIQRAMLPERIR